MKQKKDIGGFPIYKNTPKAICEICGKTFYGWTLKHKDEWCCHKKLIMIKEE